MPFRSNSKVFYGAIIIVLLSTTLFVALLPNMLPRSVFGSPDWLGDWQYRKSHVIGGASGAGTNYQVQITVHYGSGTDSGRDVYCSSHCRTDFGDIRFTAADGSTLLNYWMQSSVASDNATFWVQVAADLNSSQSVYVYYGNSGATTTSDGHNTFLLFEQSPSPVYQWVDDSAHNPVLTLSPGQWDAGTLYSNCVVYVGGTYFLYYAAAATSNYWIGAQIGVATSIDGVHWTKYGGNPIIRANSSELWKNSLVNPAVCHVGSTFYMIYTGIMSNYTSAACLATSTDGLHFTEYVSNPVLDDNSAWISRYIETCGGGLSFFDGYFYLYYVKQYNSMSMRCTGVARSTDCITWTTCAQNPVLTTSEAGYGTGSSAAVICGSVVKWGTQYLYLFCGGTAVNSPSALNLDAVISPTPWFNSSRKWSPAQNLFKPSSGIDCIALVQTLDGDGNTMAYQNNLTITYTNGVNAYHAFWVDGGASGCIPFSDSFGNGNGWQRNGPGNWRVNNGAIENNGNTINDVYLYSNLVTGDIRVGATLSAPAGKYYNAYLIARASGTGSNTNCYGINFRAYNPGGGYGPDVRILKDVNSLGWNGGGEHFITGPVPAVLPNGANVEFRVYGTTTVTLEGYLNGVKVINITDSGLYVPPFTSGLFGLQAWEQNAANGVSDYSNVYVTKFVSPEPSHGLWGSQEGYLLNVSTVGSGSVTVNNTAVKLGDVVLLTAVPAEGWSFSYWSGNLTGSANPATLTITGNMDVTATFTFTPGQSWLNGWQYRKIHVINGVATALTDYQISITLHYGSGTDLAGDVYLDSHCRSDFGDVRFTSAGGTTLLNYWFEQIVPGTQATAWIKIPSIPASPGSASIYVYYGNPTATNVSNGKNTFIDFNGDGEGWTGWTGGGEVSNATLPTGFTSTTYAQLNSTVYYPIPRGASGSWDQYLHTFQPVHKTNITEVNKDGYKFWAYYCDIYGYGVGLARSNDLINWDKYSGNPLPGLYDGSHTYYRWPTVTFDGAVFNMFVDDYPLYDGYLNFIKRYNSTDGINFSYVETVYSVPGSNYEVECPFLWFNPNDNKYYLYFSEKNQTRPQVSMTQCLSATTLDGLKTSPLIDVKPNNNDEYSPCVLYDPSTGLYWLTNEQGQSWNERAFHSSSPISGFVEASNSPILTDLDACGMQFWYNNKVYFYYNHQLGPSWAGPWDTRLQIQADPGSLGISPEAGSYRMVDTNTTYATPIEDQFSTFTTNFTLEYKTKNVWTAGKQLVDYIGVNAAVHFGACLGRNPADAASSWWYHNVPHSLSWTQLPATLVQSQWYSIKRIFDFANHKEWVYINGVYQAYYPWVEWDGTVNSIGHVWFAFGEAETGTMWVDVFRTRQYVSSEPSHGSWGSEEQSTRTRIYIDPPLTEKTFGDLGTDFWVNVAVEDIADLWGFDFNVTWDNTLITLAGVDFNTTLDAMYGVDGWFVASNKTGLGYYQLAAVGLNAGFTSTGTAPLATLQFHVENPPNNDNWQTPLHFVTDKLSNSTWSPITHTVGDGLYKITGKTPTLTMIPTSKTCRTYNETFTVAINISDASNVEDFRFEIRYNATLLDVAGVSWKAWGGTCTADEVNGILTGYASGSAFSGNMTLLTITFNATYHHIWKDESTVLGWKNIQTGTVYFQWANLSYASGPDLAYVKGSLNQINIGPDFAYTISPIRGDIDNNGQVNVFDVRTVAAFYDTVNPDYNLTGDPIIDIYDLVIVGSNFGYTYIP